MKLKLQCFGYLMQRADSLEKTLMLGNIEGKRRGWQTTQWLDGITDSMNMSLSKLRKMVKGREAWCAAVHGATKSQTRLRNWTTITANHIPVDYSPPGSSDYGILQPGTLEWVAIPFSKGSSQPGIKPGSPPLQADSSPSEPPGKPKLSVPQWITFPRDFLLHHRPSWVSLESKGNGTKKIQKYSGLALNHHKHSHNHDSNCFLP